MEKHGNYRQQGVHILRQKGHSPGDSLQGSASDSVLLYHSKNFPRRVMRVFIIISFVFSVMASLIASRSNLISEVEHASSELVMKHT